ncbi:penicillin-binding protein 1C [Patescibacteria group bacterium]|nr:penicillin-binding protein 1C [Patescibacteria group bacterium]
MAALLFWPLPKALTNPASREPTRILDRNGQLLYSIRSPDYGAQNKITFAEIPSKIIEVLIATEDRTFYKHFGVSLRGILRAAYLNFKADRIVSGGSTLTQQLVRNRLQPAHRGYWYKLQEVYFAMRLEGKLSKAEILESYLNTVYFGHQAYGISAAADIYFDKQIGELSLAESALLIGLLQSPVSLDPFRNFTSAKKRQQVVLSAIIDEEKISTSEYEDALKEPLRIAKDKVEIRAPHFVKWLQQNYANELKVGPNINTTLDLNLQNEIELIIANELSKLAEKNVTSAAVVVLDVETGELLSMIGSADYWSMENDGQVNVAISSRQPGSALKPFTYALALENGETAATTIADIETQFFTQEGNPYIPRNYDYGYHGLVRYREALANSYNIAAVKVLELVGVERLLNLLKSAGISTLDQDPEFYGLALTLGDGEVKLLDLARAYGIFARGGKTLNLKVLSNEMSTSGEQILDERVAWLIADILADEDARLPEFGADSPLNFDFPVAAKTGTTRNSRDNWTFGFTPNRIVGVWVGNADNSPMQGTSGVTGAGPIFHEVMLAATRDLSPRNFPRPSGITKTEICSLSGKLPTEYCQHTLTEFFITGTEPTDSDDIFQPIEIDTRNGLLSNNCPAEVIKTDIFAIFPLELQKWARENGWIEPPRDYSPLCQNEKSNSLKSKLEITKPPYDSFQLDPLVPDENEKIIFEARGSQNLSKIEWWVDDEFIGIGTAPDYRLEWQPEVGEHEVTAKSTDVSSKAEFEVLE